ncbi:MAG TPA: S9 family peptidase [Streptosporangiaceae bacterium]|nr:S9 family peptidase [Streptosporangiaceae bacterium]
MLLGDLREYVAIPRVTALRLAPDGSWLAAVVQTLGGEPPKYLSSIWRIDTAGDREPVRLTRSAEGEASPEFLPDGSLLFASKRPDPEAGKKDAEANKDKPAVWLLPAAGGEASRIAAPGGGVAGLATAAGEQAFVYAAAVFPGAKDTEQDATLRKARADAGVSAILHEPGGRLRYWDHDLGPESVRLLVPAGLQRSDEHSDSGDGTAGEPRDLTPDPGRALDEQEFDLAPDGSAVVTGWRVTEEGGQFRNEVVVIDASTGQRQTLLGEPGIDFASPRISPDGRLVVAIRSELDSYDRPGDATLVVTELPGTAGETTASPVSVRDLLAGFDRRPHEPAWAPDGRWVYFTADDNGRCPVFRVGVDGGEPARVTVDDAAYENLCPAPDGSSLYALRSAINSPPTPVRIPLGAEPAPPEALPSPGGEVSLPGTVTEVATTAEDGTRVRGWLVLPEGASAENPAPLLLWVHGGPIASWNSWSWRWNPWLMAARGYAVLLPDPALSTGYGHRMIVRGWDHWGGSPYADVMAITDVVVERPDIDQERTAMMGGSYGGYMANWIAGHTDRFKAIVSHAGLWALDQMFGTTDGPPFWRRQFGDPRSEPERYLASSPHLHADKIVTPMLVIHGDKDYRVPVGEALRLWWDLMFRSVQARFLYFPDENHWVLKPGDVQVWYSTVLAFLAEHVLDEEWQRPDLL